MEFLADTGFSEVQKFILKCRIEGGTYTTILDRINTKYNRVLHDKTISTILMRSALGYCWNFDMVGGQLPFLCEEDMNSLAKRVRECAEMGASLDSVDVILQSHLDGDTWFK